MPLRIGYTTIDVADAIYYAVDNGAKVINMSFGNYDITKYGLDTIVETAVNYAVSNDVVVIATAGNNSIETKRYPGALPNVIGVGSTDSLGNRSAFSNWGDWVDIAAPGTAVISPTLTGYGNLNGTSFSAPYVAGVAGLLFSQYPNLSWYEARNRIEYTADKLSTDKPIGSGEINSYRAISAGNHPGPFAIIKNPWSNSSLPQTGLKQIWGTALGDSYVLEYRGIGTSTWTLIATGLDVINGNLGQVDVGLLGQFPQVEIRLTAIKGALSDSHTVTVSTTAGYHTGFPLQLDSTIVSAPNFYDFNGDGQMEIIIGTNSGKVYIINQDGTIMPGWPQTVSTAYIYGSVAVGNIDGDNLPEIVSTSYGSYAGGAQIKAWNQNGTTVTGWPKSVGQMRGGAVLANLDSDSAQEIIIATSAQTGQLAKAYAYNGDGTLLPGWPYSFSENNLQTTPAVGDVNNDGINDIVVASGTKLVVLGAGGNLIASTTKGLSHTSPVLANLDDDADLEIIISEPTKLSVYDYTGTLKWFRNVVEGAYNQASVGDLNNDGNLEVVFAGSDSTNTYVYAYGKDGTPLLSWPKMVAGTSNAEPILADLDGDNDLDISITTSLGHINAWDLEGNVLTGFPKFTGNNIYKAHGVVDLDNNGKTELVTGGEDYNVRVWDLNSTYNNIPTAWSVSRHDVHNSGNTQTIIVPLIVDNTAPTVNLLLPLNGSTVSSPILVQVEATDNVGVIRVEVYNTTLPLPIRTFLTTPYEFLLPLSDGTYSMYAKAYDGSENVSTSSIVSFLVANIDTTPPITSITSPIQGASVSSPVTITSIASDNIGVTSMELYVDNNLVSTVATSTQSYVTVLSPGSHTTFSKAFDSTGNVATSTTVTFNVLDTTGPNVSIYSPTQGASVSSPVSVFVIANDNVGVTQIELYVDDLMVSSTTGNSLMLNYDLNPGPHSIYAIAYDEAGNIGTSTTVSIIVFDTSLPTTSITSPTQGASVSSPVTVTAIATDNIAVTKVELYIDNILTSTLTSSPYTFVATLNPGSHSVYSKAYDAENNTATSSSVIFSVLDTTAPSVSITSPIQGASVSSPINLSATANDNVAVTKIELYVDDILVSSTTSSLLTYSLTLSDGSHSTYAKAFDAGGNVSTSAVVSFTVLDTIAPIVSITSPVNNSTVSRNSTVTINASASDSVGVTKVEFYVDNVLKCSDTQTPYSCDFQTGPRKGILYNLSSKAYDAAGNIGTSATVSVTSK